MTQEQLYYVLYALSLFEETQAKTYIFLRLMGIRVLRETEAGWLCRVRLSPFRRQRFFLHTWQVQYYLRKLDFVDDTGMVPVRFERIGKFLPMDACLHGFRFSDYIKVENYYQGYMYSRNESLPDRMAGLLYRDKNGRYAGKIKLDAVQRLSVIIWFSAVKNLFSARFSHFFQRVDTPEQEEESDMEAVMNAEIRALTGGDVTKEGEVLELDCWRALTELNEKAREAQELKRKYGL